MQPPSSSLLLLLLVLLTGGTVVVEACLCHVIPNFSCPPPPHCCESGMYTFDECGCCMTCAKAELQECGGPSGSRGKCSKGLTCLKTCSKSRHSCCKKSLRTTALFQLPARPWGGTPSPASSPFATRVRRSTAARRPTPKMARSGVPPRSTSTARSSRRGGETATLDAPERVSATATDCTY